MLHGGWQIKFLTAEILGNETKKNTGGKYDDCEICIYMLACPHTNPWS